MRFYDFPSHTATKTTFREQHIKYFHKKTKHYCTEAGGLCEIEAVLRQARRRGRSWVIDGHLRGRPASTGMALQLKTIIFRL